MGAQFSPTFNGINPIRRNAGRFSASGDLIKKDRDLDGSLFSFDNQKSFIWLLCNMAE